MKFCILLTGTIAPENVPFLERNNYIDRENDYYIAINKWMEYDVPIVFCENSNYNSKKIDAILSRKTNIEYLKFKSKVSYLGKGNGEAEILDYAFEKSILLNNVDFVFKVTGRYNVENFSSFVKKINTDVNIYANLYNNTCYSDSRFFIFNKYFFLKYLSGQSKFINESNDIYFEHILARAIHSMLAAEGKGWQLLPISPILIGVSGTDGNKIKNNWLKLIAKSTFHKLKRFIFNK